MAGSKRVAVCFLGMEDPKSSVQDPAFNALVEGGFDVKAHMIVERMGKHELCLLMTRQPEMVTQFTIKNVVVAVAILLTVNLVGVGLLLTAFQ